MSKNILFRVQKIEEQIYLIRGQRILLSHHLAELYRVEAKALLQAVKRNRDRFPNDFMFQLTWPETNALSRSQIVTLKKGENLKYRPYAFTEQGIAMLSSVLRSKRAVQMNILIMRAFVKLREIYATHKELAEKFRMLEGRVDKHDQEIFEILEAIRVLITVPEKPKKRIGFGPQLNSGTPEIK